jgi:hypothetical protein
MPTLTLAPKAVRLHKGVAGARGIAVNVCAWVGGARATGSEALAVALVLVAFVGLTLIAPYSFLDGIFIMNLSGKRGSASAGPYRARLGAQCATREETRAHAL